ncbi:MAG: hypothetical protein KGJ23_05200 [Euryarchaeota archaeon]|nr:hypothetical protein [Euryarchaeota archaeon]MDE1835996.1 hypothetical protein [Euryarchaeota archaeon]MDE1880962.1 hypothetical protein [Euryarchaeota archaeon]MDE2046012.1 hypothetical protein [Thermoplasmata archaeon]
MQARAWTFVLLLTSAFLIAIWGQLWPSYLWMPWAMSLATTLVALALGMGVVWLSGWRARATAGCCFCAVGAFVGGLGLLWTPAPPPSYCAPWDTGCPPLLSNPAWSVFLLLSGGALLAVGISRPVVITFEREERSRSVS